MSQSSPLRVTVDRIEEGAQGERLAVLILDDGQQFVLPIEQLPPDTRSGMVLRVAFLPDASEETRRREEIRRLQRRLFNNEH